MSDTPLTDALIDKHTRENERFFSRNPTVTAIKAPADAIAAVNHHERQAAEITDHAKSLERVASLLRWALKDVYENWMLHGVSPILQMRIEEAISSYDALKKKLLPAKDK